MPRFLPLAFFVSFLLMQVSAQTVQPDTTLSLDDQASRLLAQATFGPSPEAITELRNLGYNYNAWIDLEVAKPPTLATPLVVAAFANDAFERIIISRTAGIVIGSCFQVATNSGRGWLMR